MSRPARTAHPDLDLISIGGTEFVSGLYWKPLRSARSYMAEAKAIGKEQGMEMVTIRKSRSVIQAGFAPKGKAKLKGKYSLAAALAGELGDNWVGAFALPDGRYAFVAVYQGAIVPGKDIVGSRDTVHAALSETYSLLTGEAQFGSDGKVFAPSDFEFGGDELSIQQLFAGKKLPAAYRLRPLTLGLTPRELVMVAIGIAALGGIGYYAKEWLDQRAVAQAAADAAAAALQAKTAEEYAAATAAAGIPRPWASLPAPAALIEACGQALTRAPLVLGGWRFQVAECDSAGTTLHYAPFGDASRGQLEGAVRASFGRPPEWVGNGAGATILLPTSLQPKDGDALPKPDEARMRLSDHFDRLPNLAQLTIAAPTVADPNVAPDVAQPDWTTSAFTVQSKISPAIAFEGLAVDAMRITRITTRFSDSQAELDWTITGELYAR